MAQTSNAHVARTFDKMADKYDRSMGVWERLFLGRGRQWATAQAHGDVLELAVGTGLNLANYPTTTRVLGIDLSEGMLAIAQRRVADLGLAERVRLQQGDVQTLDVPDASQDTVVSTYTFCTIPDPAAAAREAFRVLRPNGLFMLVEHGPSTNRVALALMRVAQALTVRFGADHLTRDPVPYLERVGFVIDHVRRAKAGVVFRVQAHKPA